jgi:hypothetical protein
MPDFDTLRDAFAELERRADATAADAVPVRPSRHRHRPILIAASVVGVAAIATGSALLAGGSDGSTGAPAAGAPTSAAAATQPAQTAPSHAAPSHAAPSSSAPSSSAPAGFQIPQTPKALADRFRVVLRDTATFTVTVTVTDTGHAVTISAPSRIPSGGSVELPVPAGKPNGAAIVGVLTAGGVSGGYDIQIFQSDPGTKATCDDPDSSTCSVRRLDDGSSLATGHEQLQNNADGVTYQADLIRPDGVEFLMHTSNERDPKGESAVLADHPPLSIDDMVAILTSDRW